MDNTKRKHPYIINIEGVDGTGKTEVSKRLTEKIESLGFSVYNTDFPVYKSPTGKLVKSFLNGEVIGNSTKADPITSSLFYTLDRKCFYENNKHIFEDYDIIISNRSYLSNLFFQASKYLYNSEGTFQSDLNNWLKYFYELEITTTPLNDIPCDNIYSFFLYHPNINMNDKLMDKRGRERDDNEKDLEYLDVINQFAYIYSDISEFIKTQYPKFCYSIVQCSTHDGTLFTIDDISSNIISLIGNKGMN